MIVFMTFISMQVCVQGPNIKFIRLEETLLRIYDWELNCTCSVFAKYICWCIYSSSTVLVGSTSHHYQYKVWFQDHKIKIIAIRLKIFFP